MNRNYNRRMLDENSPRAADEITGRSSLPARAVLVLAHLDARALGVACGLVCGLWLWIATMALVVRGGPNVGQNLSLLSQYLIGFRVTPSGAVLAFFYGAVFGFVAGYLFARLRNFMVHTYMLYLRRRAERMAMSDLLDRLM